MTIHNKIAELKETLLDSSEPLHVTFVGEFTVGKSSLINALTKREILPAALHETTARSTLIEYGDTQKIYLLSGEAPKEISIETLQTLAQESGEEEILIQLPEPWLNGIQLYDLPGTGGNDTVRLNQAKRQIAASDVIVYLIFNRGPNRRDMEMLKEAKRRGKTIIPLVTKWDEVEQSPYVPPIAEWSQKISDELGSTYSLSPVSINNPTLLENVLNQIKQVSQSFGDIRKGRFIAEALPVANQYRDELIFEKEILERQKVEGIEVLEDELDQHYDELIEFETQLEQQQLQLWEEEQARFEQYRTKVHSAIQQFCTENELVLQTDTSTEAWNHFCHQSSVMLNDTIDSILQQINESHATNVKTAYKAASALNIASPSWKIPSIHDLRESGEVEQFQMQIAQLRTALEQHPTLDLTNIAENEESLKQQMMEVQNAIREELSKPLPIIKQGHDGTGRKIGKFIGGALDLAMMLIPAGAVAQAAAKGLQGVGLAVKVAKGSKLVKNLTTGVRTIRTVQNFSRTGQINASSKTPKHVHNLAGMNPKSSFFDMLSLSHWGGVIGDMLDGPPNYIQDPAALNAQRQVVAELNNQKHHAQLELQKIHKQIEVKSNNEAEKRRLQLTLEDTERKMAQSQKKLEIQLQELETQSIQQNHKTLSRAIQQMQTRLESQALMQLRGIEGALLSSLQQVWKRDLDSQTKERRENINRLKAQLQDPTSDIQSRIEWIDQEVRTTQAIISTLQQNKLP